MRDVQKGIAAGTHTSMFQVVTHCRPNLFRAMSNCSDPLKDTDDGLRGFELKDADGYVFFFGRPLSASFLLQLARRYAARASSMPR